MAKKRATKKKAGKRAATPKKKAAKKKASKKKSAKKKSPSPKSAGEELRSDSGPRLFELHDGKSDKFWIIELSGSSHTVRYGRQGTDGQTKTKDFDSAGKAWTSYDKLIAQKVSKGYVEATSPGESRGEQLKAAKINQKEQEPFLNEIRENPDDLGAHAVFADWLEERGDPRGEFINTQLQLEDDSVKTAQRKKLQKRESELLKAHARDWLGDLAPYLLDQKGRDDIEYFRGPVYSHSFARGQLDSLTVHYFLPEFASLLRRSPHAATIRRLHFRHVPSGTELVHEFKQYAGQDWDYRTNPCFDALAGCRFDNVREFEVDEHDQCHTTAAGVEKLVRKMPRLESLHLAAHYVDSEKVFKLSMPNLRSLTVHHLRDYPVEVLARNKSLKLLESIWFFPHAADFTAEPYLDLSDLRAICRSKHLVSLKKLALYSTPFGNEGVQELIDSGMLSRLSELDLCFGAVTDEGAELLASTDLSGLEQLTLLGNYLTKKGVNVLKKTGVTLNARHQYKGQPSTDPADFPHHLYEGDIE